MIEVPFPSGPVVLRTLLLDFNGTLAVDGYLIPGVARRLQALTPHLETTVLTADTYGTVRDVMRPSGISVAIVRNGAEKLRFLQGVVLQEVAAIGNGNNDVPMLQAARIGIAVLGPEGLSPRLIQAASVTVSSIHDALDLLLFPERLVATLRE